MTTGYALGIDVGGTKIYAGVINLATGEVLNTARKRTHPERGADFFAQRVQDVAAAAIEGAKLPNHTALEAIGIGLAGQVDRERGLLLGAPNLAVGVENLPIRDLLAKRFDLPVVLGNDAEIAAFGEQQYGAARDRDDFVCVFVGTGVGGAIVIGGKLRRGTTGTAGEIGHTVIMYDGRICGCGGRGHLEAYSSRTAITRVLLAELARGRKSLLSELHKPEDVVVRSKVLAKCEDEGDALVIETLREAGDYLGAGLASLANLENPGRIIIGGGLIEATRTVFERARQKAAEIALPVPASALDIVRTQLGDDSGIIGAAWMAAHAQPTHAD
ncbi:MAG: ROK family protein [Ktedonobacterales bacterium]